MKKISLTELKKYLQPKDLKQLISSEKIWWNGYDTVFVKADDLIAIANSYLNSGLKYQAMNLYLLSIKSEPQNKLGYLYLINEFIQSQNYPKALRFLIKMKTNCPNMQGEYNFYLFLLNELMDAPQFILNNVQTITDDDLINPQIGKQNFYRLMAFKKQFAVAYLGYNALKENDNIENILAYQLLSQVTEMLELKQTLRNLIVLEEYDQVINLLETTKVKKTKELQCVYQLAKTIIQVENTLELPLLKDRESHNVYEAINNNDFAKGLEMCQSTLLKPMLIKLNTYALELVVGNHDISLDLKQQDFTTDYVFSICGIKNIEEIIDDVQKYGLDMVLMVNQFNEEEKAIVIACLAYYSYREKLNHLGDNYFKMVKHCNVKSEKVKMIMNYIEKNKKLFRNCHDTSRTLKKE